MMLKRGSGERIRLRHSAAAKSMAGQGRWRDMTGSFGKFIFSSGIWWDLVGLPWE